MVTLLLTSRMVLRPGSSSSGRSRSDGRPVGRLAAHHEIGGEECTEEHDLGKDRELDAQQHSVARASWILGDVTEGAVRCACLADHGCGLPADGAGLALIGGDPYWYGVLVTVGMCSKFSIGGGEVQTHSSVCASHGLSASATRRPRHDFTML